MLQKFNPHCFVEDYEMFFPDFFWKDIKVTHIVCTSGFMSEWPSCCYMPESVWKELLDFHQISFENFSPFLDPNQLILILSSVGAWRKDKYISYISEDVFLSADCLQTPTELPIESIANAAGHSPYFDFIDCESIDGCFVNIDFDRDEELFELKILFVIDGDFHPVWVTLGEWDILTGIKKSLKRRNKLPDNIVNVIAEDICVRATSIIKLLLKIENKELQSHKKIS